MEEGLLEEKKCIKDKKKFCIILLIISNILSLSFVVILLLILKNKNNNNEKKSSEKYSFKAIYNTIIDNQFLRLINKLPHKGLMTCDITKMTVEDEEVEPSLNYTFPYAGNHTVKFWMDITKCDSLAEMFNGLMYNFVAISFTDNFNTKNIKSMEKMFHNCYILTSLDLSTFNTENVESFNYTFYNCYKLASLNISNWNTKKHYILWICLVCVML